METFSRQIWVHTFKAKIVRFKHPREITTDTSNFGFRFARLETYAIESAAPIAYLFTFQDTISSVAEAPGSPPISPSPDGQELNPYEPQSPDGQELNPYEPSVPFLYTRHP